MHSIIFTGTDQPARECAINAISAVPVTRISIDNRDPSAVDYGVIDIGSGEKTHLYGVSERKELGPGPGATEDGSLGVVILVNNTAPSPLRDLRFYLGAFDDLIRRSSVAIGVTQMDEKARPKLEDYRREFERSHPRLPLYEVDPHNHSDVSILVLTLLYLMDPGLAA